MMHNSSCLAGATLLAYLQTGQGKLDGNVLFSEVLIRTDPWLLPNPMFAPSMLCHQQSSPPTPQAHGCPRGLLALLALAAAGRSSASQLSLGRAQLLQHFPPAQELMADSQQELARLLGLFSILQIAAE